LAAPFVVDVDEDSSQDGACKLSFDEVRCDRTGNIEMIGIKEDAVSVKDEPMSDQEYVEETSSCPPSPCSAETDESPRHYGKVTYNVPADACRPVVQW